MKTKKYLALALITSAILFVSGCGESFPEFTQEEYDQTVEFAVGLLLKYSNNDQSKLAKVDVKELKKQREKEARAAALEEKKKAESEETKNSQTKDETTKPAVTEPSQTEVEVKENPENEVATTDSSATKEDDQNTSSSTPVTETTDNSDQDAATSEQENEEPAEATDNPDAVIMSSEYSQEIINGVLLSYQGYSVSSTYPESSKSYVINADKGKKLLVLRFDLYNSADSATKVNMIEKGILVQTILNGKNLGYNAVTFLPNDLTSFVGTIDPKAHESLVVLTEIDQSLATNIQTLGMIFNIGGKETEVILK
jgi:hypothetical protein